MSSIEAGSLLSVWLNPRPRQPLNRVARQAVHLGSAVARHGGAGFWKYHLLSGLEGFRPAPFNSQSPWGAPNVKGDDPWHADRWFRTSRCASVRPNKPERRRRSPCEPLRHFSIDTSPLWDLSPYVCLLARQRATVGAAVPSISRIDAGTVAATLPLWQRPLSLARPSLSGILLVVSAVMAHWPRLCLWHPGRFFGEFA